MGYGYTEESPQIAGRKQEQLEQEIRAQKDIIRQLYSVIVRGMVFLKNLIRVGAVSAAYIWLGKREAYFLALFIAVVALVQLTIDHTRKVVNPGIKLSEWNVL